MTSTTTAIPLMTTDQALARADELARYTDRTFSEGMRLQVARIVAGLPPADRFGEIDELLAAGVPWRPRAAIPGPESEPRLRAMTATAIVGAVLAAFPDLAVRIAELPTRQANACAERAAAQTSQLLAALEFALTNGMTAELFASMLPGLLEDPAPKSVAVPTAKRSSRRVLPALKRLDEDTYAIGDGLLRIERVYEHVSGTQTWKRAGWAIRPPGTDDDARPIAEGPTLAAMKTWLASGKGPCVRCWLPVPDRAATAGGRICAARKGGWCEVATTVQVAR